MQTTAALLLKSLHHCCRIYCSVASENTAPKVAEITALQTSDNTVGVVPAVFLVFAFQIAGGCHGRFTVINVLTLQFVAPLISGIYAEPVYPEPGEGKHKKSGGHQLYPMSAVMVGYIYDYRDEHL